MGWSPEDHAQFIGQNLGPTLTAKGFEGLKIMMLDDQRTYLPLWSQTVFQ